LSAVRLPARVLCLYQADARAGVWMTKSAKGTLGLRFVSYPAEGSCRLLRLTWRPVAVPEV